MKIEIPTHTGWVVIENDNIVDKQRYIHLSIIKPPRKDENIMQLSYVPLDELMAVLKLLQEYPLPDRQASDE